MNVFQLQRVGAGGEGAVAVGVLLHGDGELLVAGEGGVFDGEVARGRNSRCRLFLRVRGGGGHDVAEFVALFAAVLLTAVGRLHDFQDVLQRLVLILKHRQGEVVGGDGLVGRKGGDAFAAIDVEQRAVPRLVRQVDGGDSGAEGKVESVFADLIAVIVQHGHGVSLAGHHPDGHLGAGVCQLAIVQHGLAVGTGLQAGEAEETVCVIIGFEVCPAGDAAAVALRQVEVLQLQLGERLGVGQVLDGGAVVVEPRFIASARHSQLQGNTLRCEVDFVVGIVGFACGAGVEGGDLGGDAYRGFGGHFSQGVALHARNYVLARAR